MRLSRLGRFLLLSTGWLVVLAVPWHFLSSYLASPVFGLAGHVMESLFYWADGIEQSDAVGTLLTRLNLQVSTTAGIGTAQLTPEANYRTFGYGLLLFWALMLSTKAKNRLSWLIAGTIAMMPIQAVAICFQWLKSALLTSGPQVASQADFSRLNLELIAFGYQFSFLVLTPLTPIVFWMLINRKFIESLWVESVLAAELGRDADAQNPSSSG